MSEQVIAERIAREAHAGQREESTGDNYIHHVERVVAMVEGEDAKAVAWLHDVLEDCEGWTLARLGEAGISARALNAVEALTRVEGESYADYIDRIVDSGGQLAVAVKLADLRDHLRPNCPSRLRPRYERALQILSASPTPMAGHKGDCSWGDADV